MTNHIMQSCSIGALETPTIIFEDNAACVVKMESGYIKSNLTKYITPKLFYPRKRMGNLKPCKLSLVIILRIYSQSLYYTTHFINALKELV
jgi:hypothetical protein